MIQAWAKAAGLWFEHSDEILQRNFGPMIAQGAEAKVYYKDGDSSVAKDGKYISQSAYQQTITRHDLRHHYISLSFTYHLDAKAKE